MFSGGNIKPTAWAELKGSSKYPTVHGTVNFYDTYGGTILVLQIEGIPDEIIKDSSGFLGFHIHEGNSCTGNQEDPFAEAGQHYNPAGNSHPDHAGDLPPVLVNSGFAWSAVFTARFYPEEIIGKTVILHGKPDDFYSQPSGNAGEKIACGEIKAYLN